MFLISTSLPEDSRPRTGQTTYFAVWIVLFTAVLAALKASHESIIFIVTPI